MKIFYTIEAVFSILIFVYMSNPKISIFLSLSIFMTATRSYLRFFILKQQEAELWLKQNNSKRFSVFSHARSGRESVAFVYVWYSMKLA